ncbi:hypothetical protein ACWD7F_30205 [Streptomyces sp. NPDC005122]
MTTPAANWPPLRPGERAVAIFHDWARGAAVLEIQVLVRGPADE